LLGASVFGIALYFLWRSLHRIHFADVTAHLASIPLPTVLLAVVCMIGSYLTLTGYDALGLRYVGKARPWWHISGTSFSAFAIGHNVGFATLSGGAIRYRAYSAAGLSATEITSVIVFCTVTFALGASILLGTALLVEPTAVLQPLRLPPPALRATGFVLLCLPVAYLFWAGTKARDLSILSWQFSPPSKSIALGQIALSVTDLCFDAAVIYLLLPPDTGLSYISFVGLFLLAVGAGLLSNVPAGLGVFEGAMLLLLPGIPSAALLGSLLLYRLIYYLLPLGIALAILAVQEFRLRHRQIATAAVQGGAILTKAAPQIIAASILVAGVILLFSGSLPAVASRVKVLTTLLPVPLLELSHLISSAIGLGLLIVARGLHRRLRGAYVVTFWLLAAGIVVSLTKGFDYEEASVLAFAAGLLWIGRKEFYRPASLLDEPFSFQWILSIALVVCSAIWLGLFVHRHVEYSSDLWWTFAAKSDAPRMLRAGLTTVILLAAFGVWRLLRPSLPASAPPTDEDLAVARKIIAASTSAEANVALTADKNLLIDEHGDAFIMYRISGHSGIALGDPVGNAERHEALVWRFRELCDRLDLRCAFYQVSPEHLPLYVDLGLTLSKLGEEGRVPLANFTLDGSKRAELRQAKNRANRDGASFEVLPASAVPGILPELKIVSGAWLAEKSVSEKGFSLGSFNERYLANFDIAVVRAKGKIVAFANIWKSGDGAEFSVDLMRHVGTAPKGVMDYLFVELMLWGKANGFAYFSMGMAPLSGLERHALAPLWHKIGNLIFRLGDEFYNFDGLRRYKEKFDPEWEPRYLAAPGGTELPRVLIDATTLISGGLKGVFAR
jgi:phosphatidylglycerol lysyltransferase